MSDLKFEIGIFDDSARRALAELRKRGESISPLMRGIGASLAEEIRAGFKDSRDPYGNPWAPLKLRRGKPLLDTGRLRNSINYKVTRSGGTVSEVIVGTNVFYAKTHQFGATIVPVYAKMLAYKVRGRKGTIFSKKSVIPPRPFLPLNGLPPSWEPPVIGQLARFIEEAKSV